LSPAHSVHTESPVHETQQGARTDGEDEFPSEEEYEDNLEEEGEEEEEDPDEDPQGGAHSPSLLGTVTGKHVGLSFYALGGTAFGKFVTCVGQIEAAPNKFEQVLRVAPDDYAIREVILRGHFAEKLLDPHADQDTNPRVEEGTWRAVRRTRTFRAEIN
jgi:hypothetical protein